MVAGAVATVGLGILWYCRRNPRAEIQRQLLESSTLDANSRPVSGEPQFLNEGPNNFITQDQSKVADLYKRPYERDAKPRRQALNKIAEQARLHPTDMNVTVNVGQGQQEQTQFVYRDNGLIAYESKTSAEGSRFLVTPTEEIPYIEALSTEDQARLVNRVVEIAPQVAENIEKKTGREYSHGFKLYLHHPPSTQGYIFRSQDHLHFHLTLGSEDKYEQGMRYYWFEKNDNVWQNRQYS